MGEALLHFIWKHRLVEVGEWRTTEGDLLQLYQPGLHNAHAGPDFTEALLKIGSERWMGSVEIHWHAKEWWQHGHQNDPAYDSVILHVVWEGTEPAQRADGSFIPTFEMKNWVKQHMLERYKQLQWHGNSIPCAKLLQEDNVQFFSPMLDRAGVERLEHRVQQMEQQLKACQGDWEQAFWVWLAGAFGLRVNRGPMEALAKALPVRLLQKHQNALPELEALLFGQAGFLHPHWEDEYLVALKDNFQYLKAKYRLQPHLAAEWKFLRMRPGGFPTRRIAQLAAMLHQSMPLFQRIREMEDLKSLVALFNMPPSTYWQQHFRPQDAGMGGTGMPGQKMIAVWIINAVVPAVFLYGRWQHQPAEMEKAIGWLEEMLPEQNNVLNLYADLGVKPGNALQSQGVLELYKHYCQEQRCLDCTVGARILTAKPIQHAKTG